MNIKNISGHGKIEYYGGDVYEGEFQKKKPHGVGKMTYKDGRVREGIWNDGEIEYKGQLNKHWKPHGKGKWFYPNSTYDGEWQNGKKHGEGTAKMSDGSGWYKGGWKNDLPEGDGTFKYSYGIYTGGIRAGKGHGNGVMTYTNGDTYKGQWKNGRKDGKGKLKFHNGDEYEGEFSNNKLHGKGKYTFAAGEYIIGEWKEGKKFGVFQKIVRVEVIEQVYYENDKLKVDSYVKRERDTSNEDTDNEDFPPIKRRSVCVSSS